MADLLRCDALTAAGFKHGFSLRTGGISDPPFHTLNLGRGLGDDAEAVWENHLRFADAVGVPRDMLFEVHQVHGVSVREVRANEDLYAVREEEHDALVAPPGKVGVGVRTADCVPVLLADIGSGRVGAAHAGWRGAVAGVVPAAVRALGGNDATRIIAVIGPHIRVQRFEIGEEVAEAIEAARPDGYEGVLVSRDQGTPHGDLAALVTAQLNAVGVTDVHDVGGCTYGDAQRFFSHRRDQGRTGRHLAAILSPAG